MKQIIYLILFDALLSFLLFLISAIILLRLIPAGRVVFESDLRHKDYGMLREKYGDPIGGLRRVVWLLNFVCFPIIAVTIGAVTGIMSPAHPGPVALLGILPFEVFALSLSKLRIREVLPFIIYAAVAWGIALMVFQLH